MQFSIDDALRHQLQFHHIGLYACINCTFGTNSLQTMREHMCLQHPTKLLYAMARVLKSNMDSVSETNRTNGSRN